MLTKLMLLVAFITTVVQEAIFFNLTEPFDVSNVLRLHPNDDDGYEEFGYFSVDVSGEARGLPLVGSNGSIYADTLTENPCCRNWTKDGWQEMSSEEAENTRPLLNPLVEWNGKAVAPIWVLQNSSGNLTSPLSSGPPQRRICVTVLARLPYASTLSVWAQRPEDNRELRIGEIRGGKGGGWQLRQLIRGAPQTFRNRQLRLKLKAKMRITSKEPLLVQWCAQCSAISRKESYTLSNNFTRGNTSSFLRSVMLPPPVKGTVDDPVCRHSGRLDLDYGLCHCSPGFAGTVCEKGCGRNKYGVTCAGFCSKESLGRQCAGVMTCFSSGKCECMAGWKGSLCDQPCTKKRFGPGCKLTCGFCKNHESCDRHTGWCNDGCQRGYQPPFCTEVCGKPEALGEALISNGREASPQDYPWSVALYDLGRTAEKTPEHICSATLVRPRFTLSAAHCVYNDVTFIVNSPERYKLGFGKFRRRLEEVEKHPERVQIRGVRSIHVPREYRGDRRLQADDIALLEMFVPVDITPYVRPVCIDFTGGFDAELYDGDIGDVVGWGFTEYKKPSETLLLANPRFISTEKCFQYVPADFIKNIGLGKFCAGHIGGAAVDHGDSGGALVFDSYIRGIVSVAPTQDFSVTSYTNVSAYRNWFSQIWDKLDVEAAPDAGLLLTLALRWTATLALFYCSIVDKAH